MYVVAGSTLEDQYTEGISGDVIARNGNTLTLQGSTLILNTADHVRLEVDEYPGAAGSRDHRDGGRQYDADRPRTPIRCRSASTSLRAASTTSLTDGDGPDRFDRHLQHQYRLGAPAIHGTMGLAGLLGRRRSGDGSANHQRLAGRRLQFRRQRRDLPQNPGAFSSRYHAGLTLPAGTCGRRSAVGRRFVGAVRIGAARFQGLRGQQRVLGTSRRRPLGGGASTAPGAGTCGIGSQVCEPASLQVLGRGTRRTVRGFSARASRSTSNDPAFTPRSSGSAQKASI